MKPTYGRVSRYGLVAFASSLDQIGPFTKDVEDCAIMMNVIAGYDPRESTSVTVDVPDYTGYLTRGVEGRTVGIPKEYFIAGIDHEVESAVRQAIAVLEGLGARCIDISLPHTDYCLAVYYIVAPSEASSNLARYDGIKYGYRSQENRELMEMYKKTRSEGLRRGQKEDHAWDVRPFLRILRRLLQEGVPGTFPDQAGLRRSLQDVRRDRDAHEPHTGLQGRREDG